nr:immunoglobulin heavy chain junction region [Mus musculus]
YIFLCKKGLGRGRVLL